MASSGWNQPIRFAVVGVLALAIVWLVITLHPLISSLVIAALLAYVLHPLVNLLARRTRLSRNAAVNIIYVLFLLTLVAVPGSLTPIFIAQFGRLSPDFYRIAAQLRTLSQKQLVIGTITIPISANSLFTDLEASISQTITNLAANLGGLLANISTNFLWILVILVLVYYLLKENHTLTTWFISLFSAPYQRHAQKLLAEIDSVWGSFLRGQLLLMLMVGILTWLGVSIVGMPGAFVIGLIAGVLDLIPSLGPTMAALIAVIIAFFEGSTYLPVSNLIFAVIILAVFIIVQQIENIWIRPALMSWQLRLHPAFIFVGVFSSLALFGILVTLIIIPLMATMGVLGRYARCLLRGIDPYPPDNPEATLSSQLPLIESTTAAHR